MSNRPTDSPADSPADSHADGATDGPADADAPGWAPLLDGELADRAREAVADIAAALCEGEPEGSELAQGAAGEAVFFAYAAEHFDDDQLGAMVDTRIDQARRGLATDHLGIELLGGVCGIGWAVDHMIEPEGDYDPNQAIDQALLAALEQPDWVGPYGLIDGLVGVGVYASHRPRRDVGAQMLAQVVRHLERLAEPAGDGLCWRSPAHELGPERAARSPDGFIGLGLSHGVPGVIALASLAIERGVEAGRARPLVDGAIAFQLDQVLSGHDARFPALLAADPPPPARSAWCYGDPGVAVALLRAARVTGHDDWERRARSIARGVAARAPDRCGVRDAGLCHGSAGLGHVLHRLYRATGDDSVGEAAAAWFARALDGRRTGDGVAGFSAYVRPVAPRGEQRAPTRGFLTGAAGVGLALLGAIRSDAPAWDQPLMTDVACRMTG